MKKKYTLTPQRKNLKNNKRAVSGTVEAVILIGIAISISSVVGISVISTTDNLLTKLSCDVQMLKVFHITDNKYLVEITLYNNGDFTFDAQLITFSDTIIPTNIVTDGLSEVAPKKSTNMEFMFEDDTINETENITLGFQIIHDAQQSTCMRNVSIT